MRTQLAFALAAFLLAGHLARAEEAAPSKAKLGRKIDNVPLHHLDGKIQPLHDLDNHKAVVIVTLSFECPVSNSYSETLARLAKEYGPKGVAFVGICPTPDEKPAEIAKQAKAFGLDFPVCLDGKLAVADTLKADFTPEVFVLDSEMKLRYRGRIDDSYYARLKKNREVSRHDLKIALDEVLAGKKVSTPATLPIGCTIFRPESKSTTSSTETTYYRDVMPILQNSCQGCHRPGEVGPFALMNYRQAVNWADDIKAYTQSRDMPPWKPSDGLAFHNERRLTDKEIATLAAWVDGGTPAGNPQDAPEPRKYTSGWQLGEPDLILEMPDDFQVGATGTDIFRCFPLGTKLPADRDVSAIEVRPGNPRVVHHALLFVDTSGAARKLADQEKERKKDDKEVDLGPGYSTAMGLGFFPAGGMGGWAPGQISKKLPEGTGYHLPKGADVVLQVHYHRTGRVEKDRTRIGIYFTDKPAERRFQGMVVAGRFLRIPADDASYKVTGSMQVNQDVTLHAVTPHMHLLGKSIKITMTPPGGQPQTLIDIKNWDYNWQESYFLKKPIEVKAGTRFEVEAVYDNSAGNPNNPNRPPKAVYIGRQTTNEMCFGFFGATSDKPGRIRFSMNR
ncbi:MAG: redoxin family protein [Gemmataceae bacterium]